MASLNRNGSTEILAASRRYALAAAPLAHAISQSVRTEKPADLPVDVDRVVQTQLVGLARMELLLREGDAPMLRSTDDEIWSRIADGSLSLSISFLDTPGVSPVDLLGSHYYARQVYLATSRSPNHFELKAGLTAAEFAGQPAKAEGGVAFTGMCAWNLAHFSHQGLHEGLQLADQPHTMTMVASDVRKNLDASADCHCFESLVRGYGMGDRLMRFGSKTRPVHDREVEALVRSARNDAFRVRARILEADREAVPAAVHERLERSIRVSTVHRLLAYRVALKSLQIAAVESTVTGERIVAVVDNWRAINVRAHWSRVGLASDVQERRAVIGELGLAVSEAILSEHVRLDG